MKKKALFIFFLFGFGSFKLTAQCCSAGNPVGSDGMQGTLSKNQWVTNLSYRYSLSEDYYHFAKKVEVPIIDNSYYNFNNLSLSYGISKKIALNAEIGYFINKTQSIFIDSSQEKIKAHGFGDLSLSIRYKLVETIKPVRQLLFSGGLRIPVGAFSEEQDGVTIPVSLQPSSGALKFNTSLYFTNRKLSAKTGWNAFLLFEKSNLIEKEYLIHKYGNYLQCMLGAHFILNKELTAFGNLKYELRGHDQRENNLKIESSGSNTLYFSPSVKYRFSKNWDIIILGDLPLYKYMNGYQLTNKFAFQVGIRKESQSCRKLKRD